jgi:hypothetical protein
MKYVLILVAAMVATGCAQFENRVFCSPSKQEAAFISWYTNYGVGAGISPKDAPTICGGAAAPVAK